MRRVLLGAVALATLGACAVLSEPGPGDEFSARATVRFLNVEGGCWRLDLQNGDKYEPVDMPAGFRTDGRQVVVKLKIAGDMSSVCQVGQLARVVEIQDQQ